VGRRDKHGDDVGGVGRCACIAFVERAVPCGWSANWQAHRPPFQGATILQHVIPAYAGNHPDVANHGPGSGGPVGRRDRRGDDVGGMGRGACIAFVERAAPYGWNARWQAHRPPFQGATILQHVIPAQAGIYHDVTDRDPGRGGLQDRRIKCADDVGGVFRGVELGYAEPTKVGVWARAVQVYSDAL